MLVDPLADEEGAKSDAGPGAGASDVEPGTGAERLIVTLPVTGGVVEPEKEEALTDKNMVYLGCEIQDGNGKVCAV